MVGKANSLGPESPWDMLLLVIPRKWSLHDFEASAYDMRRGVLCLVPHLPRRLYLNIICLPQKGSHFDQQSVISVISFLPCFNISVTSPDIMPCT